MPGNSSSSGSGKIPGTSACRDCGARLSGEPRFCPSCGVPQAPALVERDRAPIQWPRIGGCGWAIIALVVLMVAAQLFSPTSQRSSDDMANLTESAEHARHWQTIDPPAQKEDDVTGPAPPGLPRTVATAAIREAGHKCAAVAEALRIADGSIIARCTSGQHYRIFNVRTVGTVAMSCEAAEKFGVEGAC
jgi:hypothetical protein